jgi:hypothetical protein
MEQEWRVFGLYYRGERPEWHPDRISPYGPLIVEDCEYLPENEAKQRDLSYYGLNYKFVGTRKEVIDLVRDHRGWVPPPGGLMPTDEFLRQSRGGM